MIEREERLSIIVITLNEEKNISKLLTCLKEQTFKNFEVIIVDSNSDDRTKEVALEHAKFFREFRFFEMKNRGASLGRNTGANLAKYEKLLFFDADTQIEERFLEKLIILSRKKKIEVGSFYIKLLEFNLLHFLGYGFINFGFFITQFTFPTAVGACIFSSKRIHEKIGGFNEEIYLCEDCDYVKRASKYSKFRMIPMFFYFDNRRLVHEGSFKTALKYLRANLIRFFLGRELTKANSSIEYEFAHYEK